MKNVTSKPELSHPAIESKSHLFDDWFDPIEDMIRGQVRGLIEEMVRGELDATLSRPRCGRLSGHSEGRAGSITKCNTFLAGCCDGNQLRAFDSRGAGDADGDAGGWLQPARRCSQPWSQSVHCLQGVGAQRIVLQARLRHDRRDTLRCITGRQTGSGPAPGATTKPKARCRYGAVRRHARLSARGLVA